VVGWCLKKLAQWKLERGSTLEPLERLMGSQTFGSTIITQSKLGMFHATAVVLILVWMLSPLGSQSSLHLVRVESRVYNATNYTVSYFDTFSKPGFATADFTADVSLNALFSSVLMGTPPPNPVYGVYLTTVDPFDNVKIPDVFHFRQFLFQDVNLTADEAPTFIANSTGCEFINIFLHTRLLTPDIL
jgi:hypothetical protein